MKKLNCFWYYNKNGYPEVRKHLIAEFLENHGFRLMELNKQLVIVKIIKNVVEVIENEIEIRQFLIEYVRNQSDLEYSGIIKESVINLFKELKSGLIFDAIQKAELNFMEDTIDYTNKFFKNCVLRIFKDTIEIFKYEELDGYVLKSDILNHEIKLAKEDKINNFPFALFLQRCMGEVDQNYNSIQTAIGYLSSKYKIKKYNRAIIFCDQNSTSSAEGGTGKSLTAEALKNFNNSVFEDGKNYKSGTFTNQQVELGTRLFIIDDSNKNFKFESLFSSITNGFQIEKKYKAKYVMSYKDSPKILITTNYTIYGRGYSFERRIYEYEFTDYYGRNRSPKDEFDKIFFDEWDWEDWNSFYNYMVKCVQLYHTYGIIAATYFNSEEKRLERSTSKEFVEFMSDQKFTGFIAKAHLHNTFLEEYSDFKWLTQRSFNDWVRIYFESYNVNYSESKKNGGTRAWVFESTPPNETKTKVLPLIVESRTPIPGPPMPPEPTDLMKIKKGNRA